MTARIPLAALALGAAAALGGCSSNLPESYAPPPAPTATVVTPTPGTTVVTQAAPPGTMTIPPTTVIIVPGSGSTVAPPPRLSAPELDVLVRGNTASGTTTSGVPYYLHFDRGGDVKYREGSSAWTGYWRISPDGLLCTQFRNINSGIEDCYTVYRNAAGTYTYDRPDGRPVGSFTISPG